MLFFGKMFRFCGKVTLTKSILRWLPLLLSAEDVETTTWYRSHRCEKLMLPPSISEFVRSANRLSLSMVMPNDYTYFEYCLLSHRMNDLPATVRCNICSIAAMFDKSLQCLMHHCNSSNS